MSFRFTENKFIGMNPSARASGIRDDDVFGSNESDEPKIRFSIVESSRASESGYMSIFESGLVGEGQIVDHKWKERFRGFIVTFLLFLVNTNRVYASRTTRFN